MRADKSWPVVVAEDDPDDYLLLKAAWNEAQVPHALEHVPTAVDLMARLRQRPRQVSLVLLDAKMPGKSGHEALEEIKGDPGLCLVPVVMLSTSDNPADICLAYRLGAASYFTKPDGLQATTGLVRLLSRYWLQSVELPAGLHEPLRR